MLPSPLDILLLFHFSQPSFGNACIAPSPGQFATKMAAPKDGLQDFHINVLIQICLFGLHRNRCPLELLTNVALLISPVHIHWTDVQPSGEIYLEFIFGLFLREESLLCLC